MHTDDLNNAIESFLTLETTPPRYYPRDKGKWVFSESVGWIRALSLPRFAVGDIETIKVNRKWHPILGIFLDERGNWYIWNQDINEEYYEVCPELLIGHNAFAHDSTFLITNNETRIIDTMLLMKTLFGIPADKQAAYKKLKQNHEKGIAVPGWFHEYCELSLKSCCKYLLGEDLKTTKADGLGLYCANDVYATLRLAQRVIPLAISQNVDLEPN